MGHSVGGAHHLRRGLAVSSRVARRRAQSIVSVRAYTQFNEQYTRPSVSVHYRTHVHRTRTDQSSVERVRAYLIIAAKHASRIFGRQTS
jgi:hypothetical protein